MFLQKINFSYQIFCLPACAYPSKLADMQACLAKVRPSLANGSRSSRPCERRSTLSFGWRATCRPGASSSGFGSKHGPAPRSDRRTEVIDLYDSSGDNDDGDWEERDSPRTSSYSWAVPLARTPTRRPFTL